MHTEANDIGTGMGVLNSVSTKLSRVYILAAKIFQSRFLGF